MMSTCFQVNADIIVLYYNNPREIYGIPAANLCDMMDIQELVEKHTHKDNKFVVKPKKGDSIIAPFAGDFFRGIILGGINDYEATVKFIDYGNVENVLYEDMRQIPVDLSHRKALCEIFGLSIADEEVERLTDINSEIRAKVENERWNISAIKIHDYRKIPLLSLCNSKSEDILCVICKGWRLSGYVNNPKCLESDIKKPHKVASDDDEMCLSLGSSKHLYVLDKSRSYCDVENYVKNQTSSMSVKTAKSVQPGNGRSNADSFPQNELSPDIPPAPLCSGDEIYILHFESMQEVYGMLVEDKTSLENLLNYIDVQVMGSSASKSSTPPPIGKVVLAQSIFDDCWYRAKCIQCKPFPQMLYVDFGNTEIIRDWKGRIRRSTLKINNFKNHLKKFCVGLSDQKIDTSVDELINSCWIVKSVKFSLNGLWIFTLENKDTGEDFDSFLARKLNKPLNINHDFDCKSDLMRGANSPEMLVRERIDSTAKDMECDEWKTYVDKAILQLMKDASEHAKKLKQLDDNLSLLKKFMEDFKRSEQ